MGGSTERKSLFDRGDGKKGLQLFQDTNGTDGEGETTGALRIDLNLEVQVILKAKVHGDLTLALEM